MIYSEKPKDFKSKFDVVGCFLEYDGKILLVHRADHKPQGDTWGVPAGKVDPGETLLQTMARELLEETGFTIEPSRLLYFGKVYVRFPDYDFVYHMFHCRLTEKPRIILRPDEHKDFEWVTPQESLKKNLIQDGDSVIKLFYKI